MRFRDGYDPHAGILVDSSVLVAYLRGASGGPVERFAAVLDRGLTFGLEPHGFQETLQSARDQAVSATPGICRHRRLG